jgi:hypothetical protein
MATGVVDDLLVRLFLRLDAENGPALILAIFMVAVCYLLQYNYALSSLMTCSFSLHRNTISPLMIRSQQRTNDPVEGSSSNISLKKITLFLS